SGSPSSTAKPTIVQTISLALPTGTKLNPMLLFRRCRPSILACRRSIPWADRGMRRSDSSTAGLCQLEQCMPEGLAGLLQAYVASAAAPLPHSRAHPRVVGQIDFFVAAVY